MHDGPCLYQGWAACGLPKPFQWFMEAFGKISTIMKFFEKCEVKSIYLSMERDPFSAKNQTL